VGENRLPRQRQPQAESVLLARSCKRLEQPSADFGRNSRSGVLHPYDHGPIPLLARETDVPALANGFHRIGAQVQKHSFHPCPFHGSLERIRDVDPNDDALRLRARLERFARGQDEIAHVAKLRRLHLAARDVH
jgi:hypothetical protein